jgi:hypothetical protein
MISILAQSHCRFFAELLKSDIEFLKSARLKGLVWPQHGVLLSIVSMIGEL